MESNEEELSHIGIKRRSGRYPWGSGQNPYQRSVAFQTFIDDLKAGGVTDPKEIASIIQAYGEEGSKYTTTDLRASISQANEIVKKENYARARYLRDERQMSTSAIAEQLLGDKSKESTIRGWLKKSAEVQEGSIEATTNMLKQQLETKENLDVGKGVNLYIGISSTRLKVALASLKDEGYGVYPIDVPQLGMQDKYTHTVVLTKPGKTLKQTRDEVLNEGKLYVIAAQSDDGGLTFRTPKGPPNSISSKKVDVRYAEAGGAKMDGVIELRRGVPELDLGASAYAQVRIAVDGTHYLKGMAIYADDLPDGVNIRFNTNKSVTDPKIRKDGKLGAMKPMQFNKETGELDTDRPFGSSTYPHVYLDKNGNEKQSMLNIVGTPGRGNVEGRWDQWADSLSSQMLSKQPLTLAKTQLDKARVAKEEELARIKSMTNPVVKQKLLEEFADSADAAAVHLKAAKMPDQSTHVLLPMNSMRPHEIYAPNFDNGEKVVLIRHPHGGPFEIPELTVNNNNRTAKKLMGGAKDAVGIHYSVAEQLSGADFDGDSVIVIPQRGSNKVKTQSPLKDLEGFDAKARYRIPEDDTTTRRMSKDDTQREMGRVSNLITDMTIKGANDEEIARAVKHSMVVIDAEKHGLDYKQSEKDFRIAELRKDYQGKAGGGASTIISKAGSDEYVPQRKALTGKRGIDPDTGEKIYEYTGNVRKIPIDPVTGKDLPRPPGGYKPGDYDHVREIPKTTKTTKMDVYDPYDLTSKPSTPMEDLYAGHASAMKSMANEARKEVYGLYDNMPRQSKAAKGVYKDEVESLKTKLATAQRNAPLERRAQVIGGAMAKQRIASHPELDKDGIKKAKYQSLQEARDITGASKNKVYIEDREWEAIQSKAIGSSMLKDILANADMDRVKALATPSYRSSLTPGQIARAKAMAASGKGMAEIADQLGIPRSTIVDNLANA